jgi:hypothetical protein
MGGLARLPPGEASAWIQESVNLAAQLALALGCWLLARRMVQPFGGNVAVVALAAPAPAPVQ